MAKAPGFAKYPKHQVSTEPAGVRVQARYKGEVIADSAHAVRLRETMEGHVLSPAIYYFPRGDVKMDRLERTAHASHCPFKGDASYYSIKGGPENAVWSYESP